MLVDDLSLFGDDNAPDTTSPEPPVTPIADWQVDLLRKALDARGLTTMSERKLAVEAAAGRRVESLRDLAHGEALTVLSQLGQQRGASRMEKSAWDDRDEDTWIDRL